MAFPTFERVLDLKAQLKKNSFFLFGPRGVGKSTLIRETLQPKILYDLLDAVSFMRLSTQPDLLQQELELLKAGDLVVIDEIQRIPQLLNTVHRAIENKRLRFLLTGSSTRKLKRDSDSNLLAGRAWEARLFPLCYPEIPKFDLVTYLNRGGIPRAFLTENYLEELRAYSSIYLKEEILAEALVRKLDHFTRFLEVAALQSGEELSLEGIASDAQIKAKTVGNYIEILEDTLLAFRLPAFWKTKKRKAITRAKFYLFDVGLTNYLAKRGRLEPKSELFGKAFEHWLINEVRAYISYRRLDLDLFYWRSVNQQEVDLIIGSECAIEFKATSLVSSKHLKGLHALKEEKLIKNYYTVSMDERPRVMEGVTVFPWKVFLEKLWGNELLR